MFNDRESCEPLKHISQHSMFLLHAEGQNFRNYKSFCLNFTNNMNFLVGENGQGKTSLLEALFTALRGRSFKPNTGPYFIREGERRACVRLRFKEPEGPSLVASDFYMQEARLCRDLSYCGKKASRSFMEKKFPLALWIGEKLEAIKGGSSEKRKLLDEMLLFEGQGPVWERFQKCLKEKASLLWNCKKGLCSETEAKKTLSALNISFLKASLDLTEQRLLLLKRIFKKAPEVFLKIRDLDYRYEIQGRPVGDREEFQELMQEDLFKKASLELEAGRILSGPGKHDILFLFKGKNSRVFCSQGQQRVFILSLLMSQVVCAKHPLIFLDDVLSELDEKTQARLLLFLEETGCQVFITNCKRPSCHLEEPSFFEVKNGTIT